MYLLIQCGHLFLCSCPNLMLSLECNGSGVEFRILDYENPGSNPVLHCKNLGQVFSLYIAPVHSAIRYK